MTTTTTPKAEDGAKVPMTGPQFQSWCQTHNLSVEKAGAILGISKATAFKYVNGGLSVNDTVALAARLFDLLPKNVRDELFEQRLREKGKIKRKA